MWRGSEVVFEFLAWADRRSGDNPQDILPFHENNLYQGSLWTACLGTFNISDENMVRTLTHCHVK
jgi:hypothetical protein